MLTSQLPLSVVIPAHNSVKALERCLMAVSAQVSVVDEVIVVDDGSTEDVRHVAERFQATFVRLEQQSGVSAARNRGAAVATRPVLFFVDADVVLGPDAIARGRAHMDNRELDGVIGSYDDEPVEQRLVSRFKNLAHHYFHQRGAGPVASFWGACGLVRRDLFNAVGGFDESRFSRPSIEDVELGWRLADRGGRILLDPKLQVTHLKRWTITSLVTTDVIYRAMPWVRWSLERRQMPGELNLTAAQRIASVLAVLLIVTGIAAIPFSGARAPFAFLGASALFINWPLFRLFWQKGGVKLFVAGFGLQQLYYLCALTGLVFGVLLYYRPGRRQPSAPPARIGC